MVKSRKDSRGYALHTRETQRKDGHYAFQYMDVNGKRRTIYARELAELRKLERKLIRDKEDGLDPHYADRITLNQLFDKYILQKHDLKQSTKTNYKYMYDHYVRDTFGKRIISKIKYSDVKEFYYSLILVRMFKANSMEVVNTLLHPTFRLAVRDGLLRTNPTDGVMGEIKKSHCWNKPKRHALTIPQQKAFMNYIVNSEQYRGWKPIVTVLLGTGCRIGETLGLRWDDIDFDKKLISINHNLVYRIQENGTCENHITTPKTKAGVRLIPIIKEVYNAFLEEYEIQKCIGFNEDSIDGYTGFVFSSGAGHVYTPQSVNRAIKRIYEAYNAEEIIKAEEEERDPVIIPHFSCHHLRHTFCTRFCENETNLKVIQEIMGHSDITTTMNIYAEATTEKKQEVLMSLENKIMIM